MHTNESHFVTNFISALNPIRCVDMVNLETWTFLGDKMCIIRLKSPVSTHPQETNDLWSGPPENIKSPHQMPHRVVQRTPQILPNHPPTRETYSQTIRTFHSFPLGATPALHLTQPEMLAKRTQKSINSIRLTFPDVNPSVLCSSNLGSAHYDTMGCTEDIFTISPVRRMQF